MLSDDVVIDTSRHPIVSKMTGWELVALAKGATRDLKRHAPATRQAISQYEQARMVEAECIVKDELYELQALPESEAKRFPKKKEMSCQRMSQITDLTNQYRKSSAYRFFAVLAVASEHGNTVVDTQIVYDLHTLNACQASHYRSLLISDTLRYLKKMGTSIAKHDVKELDVRLQRELKKSTLKVRRGLEQLKTEVEQQSSQALIEEISARTQQIVDSDLKLINETSINTECFRRFNRYLTLLMSDAINDYGAELHPRIYLKNTTLDENGQLAA